MKNGKYIENKLSIVKMKSFQHKLIKYSTESAFLALYGRFQLLLSGR